MGRPAPRSRLTGQCQAYCVVHIGIVGCGLRRLAVSVQRLRGAETISLVVHRHETIDLVNPGAERQVAQGALAVEFEQLLAEPALHHLDLVFAGQPAPRNPNLRLASERLVESTVEWYGPAAHVHKADADQFPQSLNRLPVLLPTGHSALRPTLDRWFEAPGLRPRIVGKFEDSALLAVFAARGLGGCSWSAALAPAKLGL